MTELSGAFSGFLLFSALGVPPGTSGRLAEGSEVQHLSVSCTASRCGIFVPFILQSLPWLLVFDL